jgi:3-methyladenine DNA glycosylase AlkD
MQTVVDAQAALRAVAKPDRVESTGRFFKAYPGGYSEGDKFLGCTVPATRQVAKHFYDLPLSELDTLIKSEWHDDRLLALIILVEQYKRGDEPAKKAVYDFYMNHTANVNNWDLVDTSSEHIVGPYLENRPEKLQVLQKLADSKNLWERRIAMLATFDYIKKGRADDALTIAEQLLHDTHDLIQKAVGWMLREIGKRVDRTPLLAFLDKHAATMPRTTLRYAIEHLSAEQRAHYMQQKGKGQE